MMNFGNFNGLNLGNGMGIWPFALAFLPFVWLFVIVDIILRGFALWRSAKRNENVWFIALLLINSLGILPLIYLLLHRDVPVRTSKKK